MSSALTNLLQDVVKKAASAPAGTNPELAKIRARFQDCGNDVVILADCSGSMAERIGGLPVRKIEHLRIALTDLLKYNPAAIIIIFGWGAQRIKNIRELPNENNLMGGTDMTSAIEEAAKLKPRRTVIISDGLPDNEKSASDAVDNLTGQVDAIYCGPDGHPAIQFLQSLARKGGGNQMTFNGTGVSLGTTMQRLLA